MRKINRKKTKQLFKKQKMKRVFAFIMAACFLLQGPLGVWMAIDPVPAVSLAATEEPVTAEQGDQVTEESSGTAADAGAPGAEKSTAEADKAAADKSKAATVKTEKLVNGADLKVGDMVKKKTLIRMDNTKYDGLCLDGTKMVYNYKDSDDGTAGYIVDDNVIVVEDNPDKKGNYLFVETIYKKGHVLTEQVLLAMMSWDSTVTLNGNILLSKTLNINDGEEHTIDLNGYALDLSGGKKGGDLGTKNKVGSVIWVHGGSKLVIKDSSKDKSGEICGGNANQGGGICVSESGSALTMTGGNITLNNAPLGGGIVLTRGVTAKLTGVTISQNNLLYQEAGSGADYGGGLYIGSGAKCELKDCVISGNYCKNGGGISNTGTLTMENTDVKGNQASGEGAGLFTNGTENTLIKSDISSNMGKGNGGGISNHANMTMEDCTVSNNSAGCGGGIYTETKSDHSKMVYKGKNKIKQNNSTGDAGGIFIVKAGSKIYKDEISNIEVSNNYAANSAGGICVGGNLEEVTLKGITVKGNQAGGVGGGIVANSAVTVKNCEIKQNNAKDKGGAIYSEVQGQKQNLTVTNTSIQENTCYGDGGAGIFMADDSTNPKLVLGGGKTVIYMNRKVGSNNQESENDVQFNKFREIKIAGKFEKDSVIGLNCTDSFNKRTMTKDYKDYNSASPDTYFEYNGSDHKINSDSKQSEVVVVKRLQPSASGYKVRVRVEVTDDADDWDDARISIYCKRNYGVGSEYMKYQTGDIKGYIDHDRGVYDNTWDCGSDFPENINVYANFGGGWINRVWKANVTVWINDINVKSYKIHRDVWGNTAKKGQASNWVTVGGDQYPYPDPDGGIEINQKREIDLLDEKSKEVSLTCVDQYGVKFRPSEFRIENVSFPKQDSFESLDDYGLKWKFDTSKNDCHNSIYKLKFRSGSNLYPWIEVPISVRFKVPLTLKVKMGDKVILEKKGYQNDTVKLTGITPDKGYRITGTEKKGLCILQSSTDGNYDFTFLTENVEIDFATSPIKYYVVFDNNASDKKQVKGSMSKLEANYDTKAVLPLNVFTSKKGYVFSGWNTEKDGSGKSFEDGDTVLNLLSEQRAKITLYAQWRDAEGRLVSASIFSEGRIGIWMGMLLLVIFGIFIGCYVSVKKR